MPRQLDPPGGMGEGAALGYVAAARVQISIYLESLCIRSYSMLPTGQFRGQHHQFDGFACARAGHT